MREGKENLAMMSFLSRIKYRSLLVAKWDRGRFYRFSHSRSRLLFCTNRTGGVFGRDETRDRLCLVLSFLFFFLVAPIVSSLLSRSSSSARSGRRLRRRLKCLTGIDAVGVRWDLTPDHHNLRRCRLFLEIPRCVIKMIFNEEIPRANQAISDFFFV